jgi:hypothetical protein
MYKRSLIWKRSLLGQKHPTFCCVQTHKPFMFIGTNRVLAHWSNSSRIDTSLHSKTLSLFRANQFLLLLLNVVCFTLTPECCVLYSYSWMMCALLLLLNDVCFTLTPECCVLYREVANTYVIIFGLSWSGHDENTLTITLPT